MREARSSPPAHRGARVIGTDALRFVLILREPRDGQERKQDSEDDPNINAHQSSPAARSYPPIRREYQRHKSGKAHRVSAPTRRGWGRRAGACHDAHGGRGACVMTN